MTYDRGDAVGLMLKIKNKKGSPGSQQLCRGNQEGLLAALRVIGLDVAGLCHSGEGMRGVGEVRQTRL